VLAGAKAPARHLVLPLAASGRNVGALTIAMPRAATPRIRTLVSGAAGMLASALRHAEDVARLGEEVDTRARQIDQQRRFTERIIDSLTVGLYVIDRDFRIHAWNRKRETGMQGVSREEAIGRTIFEILHRQPADVLRGEFETVFATGQPQQFHMQSRATGDLRHYRISKIPMRLNDGAVTHVITIGEDITDWQGAIQRTAQAEKLAAIGTLAAGVMHEINNPLATVAACGESIGLQLDDLRESGIDTPTELVEYLRIIDSEVHRCKRIIDGLLDFSRPKPVTKSPLDLNAVIDHTLFLLKHHTGFKRVTVTTALEPSLAASLLANEEQLVQVFMALLLNAMDAMDERGSIHLSTHRDAGSIIAVVTDTGHGIARSELTKLFEPFYTTKAPGRGTGLGLSICYGIISDHGGRIEVESEQGRGTSFRIVLPEVQA
jgi:two-component system NtrC family sensor kinase